MSRVRSFEEAYEQIPATGWLSRKEAELLWDTAIMCSGPILEVGCYHGRSTCLLAALGRRVYSVDPFAEFDTEDITGDTTFKKFLRNLEDRRIRNVTLFKSKIEDWDPMPVGFAYLDGDHTQQGTKVQIEKALASNASWVGIHDVNDAGGGLAIRDEAVRLLGPWIVRIERLAVWKTPEAR